MLHWGRGCIAVDFFKEDWDHRDLLGSKSCRVPLHACFALPLRRMYISYFFGIRMLGGVSGENDWLPTARGTGRS